MQSQTQTPAHRITAAYRHRESTHRALNAPGEYAPRDAYAAELAYRFSTLAPLSPPYGDTLDRETAYLIHEQTAYLLGLGLLAADFLASMPGLSLSVSKRARSFRSLAEEAMTELIEYVESDDPRLGAQVKSALQPLKILIHDLHAVAAHLQCKALDVGP